jgi:hypothetical protein
MSTPAAIVRYSRRQANKALEVKDVKIESAGAAEAYGQKGFAK